MYNLDIWNIQGRVERGAALLDRKAPGWRDRVAPGDLDMDSCERCVVGQALGEYCVGIEILGVDAEIEKQITHGFEAAMHDRPFMGADIFGREWIELKQEEYRQLEIAWLERIKNV